MLTIVIDPDPLARRLVRGVLESAGIAVAAEARDHSEAVDLALEHRPDVVVMDVGMPGLDGIRATRAIRERIPDQLVVLLTGAADDEIGLLALRVGAAGFLSKEIDIDALPRALQSVRAGEAAISRHLTRRLLERVRRSPSRSPLSAREWEVLDLLKPGATTDDIAATLVLSKETVRSHVRNITRKLGVHSRVEAFAVAERMRLVA